MISAGKTDDEIREFMIERYGDWISYRPSAKPIAWPLWAAPVVLLIFGAAVAAGRLRRKRRRLASFRPVRECLRRDG